MPLETAVLFFVRTIPKKYVHLDCKFLRFSFKAEIKRKYAMFFFWSIHLNQMDK